MSFIRIYFLSMLLGLGLWSLVVWGQVGNPTKGSQWIAEAYKHKEKYAKSIETPKIVIVAGSNGLFGIDSGMLGKAFNMPVVNMCVNAGIDLPPILEHGKRVIKEGDTVLLPLEYPLYSYNGEPIVQMIDYLYAREPRMLDTISYQEQFWILWHLSIKRLYAGYMDGKDTPISKGVYGVHNIDFRGDQLLIDSRLQQDAMRRELANQKPETYGIGYKKDALGWEYLEQFVQWCRARDVQVVFMPSTLMDDPFYHNDPKEKSYYKSIANRVREQGWIYVGDPYSYMYAPSLYFNTNFHLNSQGRKIRTQQMIEELGKKSNILK